MPLELALPKVQVPGRRRHPRRADDHGGWRYPYPMTCEGHRPRADSCIGYHRTRRTGCTLLELRRGAAVLWPDDADPSAATRRAHWEMQRLDNLYSSFRDELLPSFASLAHRSASCAGVWTCSDTTGDPG
jgi:hypothetical protein